MTTQHKGLTWTGRVMSGLVVAMLTFSAVMKFTGAANEEFTRLGYPGHVIMAIAFLEIACALIYAVPQTAILGAVLLIGYLGGATAAHVRIDDPWFGPVIGGVLVWLGIFLREPRLRALIPWRNLTPVSTSDS